MMSDRQLAFIRQAARQKRIILGLRLLIFVLFLLSGKFPLSWNG